MKTDIIRTSITAVAFLFTINLIAQQYCVPPGFLNMGGVGEPFTFISKVKLEDLNNPSGMPTGMGEDDGYMYYDNANVPYLLQGESYLLNVTSNDNLGQGMEVRVWIDWNGDRDFHPTNELAAQWGGASGHSKSIEIPSNAKPGVTRMRVYCDMPSNMGHIAPEPCGYMKYPGHAIGQHGEVEDYDIEVGSTVGIEERDHQVITTVYPNPSGSNIIVKHELTKSTPFRIIDIYGRTVQSGMLEPVSASLDVSGLATGRYMIMLEGESVVGSYSISISR